MRAVVHDQPGSFTVRDVPTPEPGSGDVPVQMAAAGMGGTDRHLHEGQFLANFPLTPGHQTVGEVTAVGADATDGDGGALLVGQQVVINPNSSCRACAYCTEERPWLCESFAGIGSSTLGAFADYVLVAGAQLFDATGIDSIPSPGAPWSSSVRGRPVCC